ncbi:SET domain-containing protein [Ascobolus immersus RN42]|uniref:SET domain-containing protein n=1 Tax=Ascobolus immersus RN42 TaxID=1160509 RepID=A0A3N4HPL6_ASCIM|nr:SET domain-containing protein [Ascobolus immersus RN42]
MPSKVTTKRPTAKSSIKDAVKPSKGIATSPETTLTAKPIRTPTKIPSTPIPFFTIEYSLDKGQGLIAARNIPAGTCILSESALVVMPQKLIKHPHKASQFIYNALKKLPLHLQDAFRQLHRNNDIIPTETALYEIFLVNCADRQDGAEAAVYKTFSRINHSCDPNCEQAFEAKNNKQVVYTIRDIKKGEEIYISYRNVLEPSTLRLPNLKRHYDFVCKCPVCDMPEEKIQERDRKLIQLDKITSFYNSQQTRPIRSKLELLRRKYEFMVDLDIKTSVLAQPLFEAMNVCAEDMGVRGAIFGLLAHKIYVRCCGPESVDVKDIEETVLEPVRDMIIAVRWDGETILGMPKTEFMDWLWGKCELA